MKGKLINSGPSTLTQMPRMIRRRRHHPGGRADPTLIDPSSTTARVVCALENAAAKPICEGGLAQYFVAEAHRRAALEEAPRTTAPSSAILALTMLPASHRGRGDLTDCCSVCLDGSGNADTEETLTLRCNHKFHKRCILGWLAVNSVCPCCRAQVVAMEPYRYPARTALRSTFLRERMDLIVNWPQVSWQTRCCFEMRPRTPPYCPALVF